MRAEDRQWSAAPKTLQQLTLLPLLRGSQPESLSWAKNVGERWESAPINPRSRIFIVHSPEWSFKNVTHLLTILQGLPISIRENPRHSGVPLHLPELTPFCLSPHSPHSCHIGLLALSCTVEIPDVNSRTISCSWSLTLFQTPSQYPLLHSSPLNKASLPFPCWLHSAHPSFPKLLPSFFLALHHLSFLEIIFCSFIKHLLYVLPTRMWILRKKKLFFLHLHKKSSARSELEKKSHWDGGVV